MSRQRNNIFAVAADAVDLALDTAGTIGSMVGGMANIVGIGSEQPKSEGQERREADDAAKRVATSLRQEAEAARPRKAKPRKKAVGKSRSAKSVKRAKKVAHPQTARKVA